VNVRMLPQKAMPSRVNVQMIAILPTSLPTLARALQERTDFTEAAREMRSFRRGE
jgi:hypothetical protein